MSDAKKYSSKLLDKRVLIIGGSSGIGYGVAEASLEFGARVTIASSQQSRVDEAVSSLLKDYPSAKDRLRGFTVNLGEGATLEKNTVELLEKTGKLDHIVYTAGDALTWGKESATGKKGIQAADFDSLIKGATVRYFASHLLAKHAPDYLEPSYESSFTLTTGTLAEKPIPGTSPMAGFAVGIHGAARGLAVDLAPIRVNAVGPGPVDTPLWDGFGDQKAAMLKHFESTTVTGRVSTIQDVAEAYMFLMKDYNVTGTVVRTDGGSLIK